MTTTSIDTHPAMDACPPLEDIAAFLDGMLPPEERERITAHLARCESCYEIFAGAAEFQMEPPAKGIAGGDAPPPLPFVAKQDRAPRRIPRWLPLAASVVLVAGAAFFAWRSVQSTEMRVAGLTRTLEGQPGVADHLFKGDTLRSGDKALSPGVLSEFMTGVHLIDLRHNVESGRFENTRDLLQKLGIELEAVILADDLSRRYLAEFQKLPSGMDVRQLKPKLQTLEDDVQEHLSVSVPFSFGLWVETGRLAALTRSPEFFETRRYRRFLDQALAEPPIYEEELQELIRENLEAIQKIWDRGNLSREDYAALAGHFESIIKQVEATKELLSDDLTGT